VTIHPSGRPISTSNIEVLRRPVESTFITTSRFTSEAYSYANKVAARIILIDGSTLAELLVKHNIGVQDHEVYILKRIDEDFFELDAV